jgi:hypothetical protein
MLVINDQLKEHLEGWDWHPMPLEACLYPDDGRAEESVTAHASRHPNAMKERCWNFLSLADMWVCGVLVGVYFLTEIYNKVILGSLFVGLLLKLLKEKYTIQSVRQNQLKLMHDLAVLGAPPFATKPSFLREQIELVKASQDFVDAVDDAMERVKSSTSMIMGLGIWSPCIHRISANRPRPPMEKCKRQLALSMLHYMKLLGNVSDVPEVVTLTWLHMMRRRLPEALSSYLSSFVPTESVETLNDCRARIKETVMYLNSSFGLEVKQDYNHTQIDRVAQRLHAAEIAIWAYSQDQNETARNGLIKQFQRLLDSAHALLQDQRQESDSETADYALPSALVASGQEIGPRTFEHNGQETNATSRRPPSNTESTKVLVYSGKGHIQPKRQLGTPPTVQAHPNVLAMQTIVFQELEERLSAMELAEEFDINKIEDRVPDDANDNNESESRTTAGFTPSGSLLSELQSLIKRQSQFDSAISREED